MLKVSCVEKTLNIQALFTLIQVYISRRIDLNFVELTCSVGYSGISFMASIWERRRSCLETCEHYREAEVNLYCSVLW